MLAYDCIQCGKIIIGPYENEYNQHFCSEKCYEIYCGIHGHEVHKEKLHKIKTALD